jgi:hypothetical protein
MIGEGSAEGDSKQTLVIVKVVGSPSKLTPRSLIFRATADGKELLKKTDGILIGDKKTHQFNAYLLYNTACEPIQLIAQVVNKDIVESEMKKEIPFSCGE